VLGRGVERLREAGIEVTTRILERECDELIRPFRKHITTGRPFVVLKAAATLDGKLATRTGDSKWISGEGSRQRAHVWRDEFDAVLVGAGTVRADNPLLTTRLTEPVVADRWPRNPIRIVLAGSSGLEPSAHIFEKTTAPTILVTSVEHAAKWDALRAKGVEVLTAPSNDGRVSIEGLLDELGERGITSLLVEGGAAIHASFLKAGLVDEVRLFVAPRIVGGEGLSWVGALGIDQMWSAWRLGSVTVERIGEDLLVIGQPLPPEG
jgi:diaminohydroxyphosphoribosylaminopyrimidine deaminase/5-amino-6-(5-phosphoribosylamino)uracil reductase